MLLIYISLLHTLLLYLFFFFFQAEDGIRDYKVTGVQTCALPICVGQRSEATGEPAAVSDSSRTIPQALIRSARCRRSPTCAAFRAIHSKHDDTVDVRQ